MSIADAARLLERFTRGDLTREIAAIERSIIGRSADNLPPLLSDRDVDSNLVRATLLLKNATGQINTVLHAVGILLSLTHILEPTERVLETSLGAGNTGRRFDLETDQRIAEFKFIRWRGGAESIRQNSLFKDFYMLAEETDSRKKCLYVLGLEHPLKFLNSGRAIKSVLSRNNKLSSEFIARHGDRFVTVDDYFQFRREEVQLVDLRALVPEFQEVF